MEWNRYAQYAPFVMRLGLGLVLLWFGIDEIRNPITWASLVPAWATNLLGISGERFMQINGGFEIILALLLFIGFYTRLIAVIVAVHFASVILVLGYGDLAVRDFGLLIAAISLILSGGSGWSWDHRKKV